MTNRALLYGNFVNENFFGGGNNEPRPLFRLGELGNVRYRKSKVFKSKVSKSNVSQSHIQERIPPHEQP